VKLLREKSGVESDGFAIGIDQNKQLGTWRERGGNNTEGIHILERHRSLLATQRSLRRRLKPAAANRDADAPSRRALCGRNAANPLVEHWRVVRS
jgi:hypothetical protein